MIEFMVIGAPRSGTAWAANFFTTDTSLCLHDPLWQTHYGTLDRFQTVKRFGIACTGSALFTDWLASHPAPKVILHRESAEIDESLAELGLPPLAPIWRTGLLNRIDGLHVHWRELFAKPEPIWRHLMREIPFNRERHSLLCALNVQMAFERIAINRDAAQRLFGELAQVAVRSAP